ncbi:hypothetical protein PR048_033581 [Dryococelus australis]|uniref:Uncharacterized protein n=1 Tax=Dryococelus australis TaxID=614101 RepID=A0ABQ9G1X5_9NEOP|nr:hypothetical protein PR048_033581 [Dryococelus australis]
MAVIPGQHLDLSSPGLQPGLSHMPYTLLLVHTTLGVLTVLYNVRHWLVVSHWSRSADMLQSNVAYCDEDICKLALLELTFELSSECVKTKTSRSVVDKILDAVRFPAFFVSNYVASSLFARIQRGVHMSDCLLSLLAAMHVRSCCANEDSETIRQNVRDWSANNLTEHLHRNGECPKISILVFDWLFQYFHSVRRGRSTREPGLEAYSVRKLNDAGYGIYSTVKFSLMPNNIGILACVYQYVRGTREYATSGSFSLPRTFLTYATVHRRLFPLATDLISLFERLDSTAMCILEPQMIAHWLLPHTVANVTSHLAVRHWLLVSLKVFYWLRVFQGVSNKLRYKCEVNFSVHVFDVYLPSPVACTYSLRRPVCELNVPRRCQPGPISGAYIENRYNTALALAVLPVFNGILQELCSSLTITFLTSTTFSLHLRRRTVSVYIVMLACTRTVVSGNTEANITCVPAISLYPCHKVGNHAEDQYSDGSFDISELDRSSALEAVGKRTSGLIGYLTLWNIPFWSGCRLSRWPPMSGDTQNSCIICHLAELRSASPARLSARRTGFNPRPGHSQIFACGNRAGRCRWSAGFLGDLQFPPPPSFQRCSTPTSITLIGSQDLAVKSRPNFFAHSLVCKVEYILQKTSINMNNQCEE